MRSEHQLRTSLEEDFGRVKEVFFLRDSDGELKGSAYIRFAKHQSAKLYIDAEAGAAAWSEAERASQRASSVYNTDLHDAFVGADGRAHKSVLARCGVPQLWV